MLKTNSTSQLSLSSETFKKGSDINFYNCVQPFSRYNATSSKSYILLLSMKVYMLSVHYACSKLLLNCSELILKI